MARETDSNRADRPVARVARCGILYTEDFGFQDDLNGCILPDGHAGPHEFVARDGSIWQWETDMECTCDHCIRAVGDYCTFLWEKMVNGGGE